MAYVAIGSAVAAAFDPLAALLIQVIRKLGRRVLDGKDFSPSISLKRDASVTTRPTQGQIYGC